MALYHHDARDYGTAAREASAEARMRMERVIEQGRSSALRVFEHVQTHVPQDQIAAGRALRWGWAAPVAMQPAVQAAGPRYLETADEIVGAMVEEADAGGVRQAPAPEGMVPRLVLEVAEASRGVHGHALSQVAQRAGVPTQYLRTLLESANPALRGLGQEILEAHYGRTQLATTRFLLRSVRGEVRGFLSDKYRRLDNRPLLEAFASACQQVGAVPVEGVVSDVRVAVKAYLPVIFEPVEHEPMLVGLQWHNSDFGAGAHCVALTVLRLWCTNKAVMDAAIRDVHLGRRLPDDVAWSERTLQLDTATSVSALQDAVGELLGPAKVDRLMAAVAAAAAEETSWASWAASVRKQLTKAEWDKCQDMFDGQDVVNLPAGNTAWRASNALSWLAGTVQSPDRQLELERLAGKVLDDMMVAA